MYDVILVPENKLPKVFDKMLEPWGWDGKRYHGKQLYFKMNTYQVGKFLEFLEGCKVQINNMRVTPSEKV